MKEKLDLAIGDVLIQDTCDAIDVALNGQTKAVNPHKEHWVIEDIKGDTYHLYNLDTQRTMKMSEKALYGHIKIYKSMTISDEKA